MERTKTTGDVGVIVARFQVPYLHEAHTDLIDTVMKEHDKVIIFLGLSPTRVTFKNPLDFEARKQMILDEYPEAIVLYIKDMVDDSAWSKILDSSINDIVSPNQTAVLYGSRDSFISHYDGKHETVELIPDRTISGTELRRSASRKVRCSPQFREGVIWAASNQYPKVWPTIDAAILKDDRKKLLLGRKPHEKKYRFIGGFVDPTDKCLEHTVAREVREEAGGISIGDITYVSSHRVDDWRYEGEIDKLLTTFFTCTYMHGPVEPGDDICEVRWFSISDFCDDDYDNISHKDLVDEHHVLMDDLIHHLKNKKCKI